MSKLNQAICPVCEADVSLEKNTFAGELISCADCGADLEVNQLENKFTLTTAPEIEEDWGE